MQSSRFTRAQSVTHALLITALLWSATGLSGVAAAPLAAHAAGRPLAFGLADPTVPAAPAALGTPALVADVNPAAEPHGSDIYYLDALGGQLALVADDGRSGREIWRTNGTITGTTQVIDLCPGPSAGAPAEGLVYQGALYFGGYDCSTGSELWRTDGTFTGTTQVADISPGVSGCCLPAYPNTSQPRNFTVFNSKLYFTADGPVWPGELWQTDGTLTNTLRLSSIYPGDSSANVTNLVVFSNTLFFAASGPLGTELYASDGTITGTGLFLDLNAASSGAPSNFTVAGDQLFFIANLDNATTGRELWVTDGTVTGTQQVKNIVSGSGTPSIQWTTALDDLLIFSATDGTHGREIWASDGTLTGTFMISDINPSTSSNPANLLQAGNYVYFSATDAVHGLALFRTNGSTVEFVADPNAGSLGGTLASFAVVTNTLYFAADDGVHGQELWKHNAVTTTLVADIVPGLVGSGVLALRAGAGNQLFFVADDGTTGLELWVSNGTGAGTTLLKNFNPDVADNGAYDFLGMDTDLYFAPVTAALGRELWRSGAATVLVSDTLPGSGSGVQNLVGAGAGRVFFVGSTPATGSELWAYAPGSPPILVRDIYTGTESSHVSALTRFGAAWYFSAEDGVHGQELWRTDGTPAGTWMVAELYPGFFSSEPQNFTAFDGWLYFLARDAAHGQELWRTDGTAAQTTRLTDLNPGANDSIYGWVAATDDYLFFTADDGSGSGGSGSGVDLWRWDGSTLSRGDDLNPTDYEDPQQLTVFNGAVYFAADDGTSGYELWRADGVTTTMLADIYPGLGAGGPAELTVAGSQLFFTALDPTGGFELWVTDGTPGGTQRVVDLYPGSVGSLPTGLTAVGHRVVFAAAQPATGYELWQSDGTPGGTTLLADVAPGAENFNPQQMTLAGGSLYFTADTPATGRELWSLPLSTDVSVSLGVAPDPALTGSPLTYTLTITNVGDSPAAGVTLTDTLPAGFVAAAGAASQGACSGSGPLVCALGSLGVGASALITITATPTLAGVYTNTVTVSTYMVDLQPANNSALAAVTIVWAEQRLYLPLVVR